jgi:hypothetical protein
VTETLADIGAPAIVELAPTTGLLSFQLILCLPKMALSLVVRSKMLLYSVPQHDLLLRISYVLFLENSVQKKGSVS